MQCNGAWFERVKISFCSFTVSWRSINWCSCTVGWNLKKIPIWGKLLCLPPRINSTFFTFFHKEEPWRGLRGVKKKMSNRFYFILFKVNKTKEETTCTHIFKFYGKVGVISWLLFHLIWKITRSTLRFWLGKLNCGFFQSLHSWKNTTKQLFSSKFQCRK